VKKFTFVVSRYGEEILGGAEKHARDIAEHLAEKGHDVRVLTSCAKKYTTWANEYPEGTSRLNGVEVERHRLPIRRLTGVDDVLKTLACALPSSKRLAKAWYAAAGPIAPSIVKRAEEETRARDLVIHFSLQSWITAQSLDRAPRAALVPVVHDEPPTYLSRSAEILRKPAVIIANTEEEWTRIRGVAGRRVAPGVIVATGQGEAPPLDPSFRAPVEGRYLLILGRMAKAKPAIETWKRLHAIDPSLKLLAVGEVHPAFAQIPGIVSMGFVDDATRWQLMRRATALINPSRHESLSLVLLEAWVCDVPVIVSSLCDVTVGQCARSNGGFSVDFADPARAAKTIAEHLREPAAMAEMGRAGHAYVSKRYAWSRIVRAYEAIAEAMSHGPIDADALRLDDAPLS
jgi:glycosyltransferase involved in cell wall biosynthesis